MFEALCARTSAPGLTVWTCIRLQVPQIKEIVEGLLPYSQRHFNRMDRLVGAQSLLFALTLPAKQSGNGFRPNSSTSAVWSAGCKSMREDARWLFLNFGSEYPTVASEPREAGWSKRTTLHLSRSRSAYWHLSVVPIPMTCCPFICACLIVQTRTNPPSH